jgi:hypothetical protein
MYAVVGTTVKLKVPCLGNEAGTRGVCYEVYTLGQNHVGASFIFANGRYDGFSKQECDAFLEFTGFDSKINEYDFKNVILLSQDFDRGVFTEALR